MFRVSQLKKLIGNVHTSNQFPLVLSNVVIKEPEFFLDRKMAKRQGRAATMVLIQWKNQTVDEET